VKVAGSSPAGSSGFCRAKARTTRRLYARLQRPQAGARDYPARKRNLKTLSVEELARRNPARVGTLIPLTADIHFPFS